LEQERSSEVTSREHNDKTVRDRNKRHIKKKGRGKKNGANSVGMVFLVVKVALQLGQVRTKRSHFLERKQEMKNGEGRQRKTA
jgi:hypothetical protein